MSVPIQKRKIISLENISISLAGDYHRYHQNYALSAKSINDIKTALKPIPFNERLERNRVSDILAPGGLPNEALKDLVFREDLEHLMCDSMNWHLYYACKPQGQESNVILRPHLSFSLNDQSSQLSVFSSVSMDIGKNMEWLKEELAGIGEIYAKRYIKDMLIFVARSFGETHGLHFLPLEDSGYLLNALMHLTHKIDESQLKQLYELKYSNRRGGSSPTSSASIRKLRCAIEGIYEEKQEELIEMLGSPFYSDNRKYCSLESL